MKSTVPLNQLGTAVLAWTQDLAPHGILVTDHNLKIRGWNNWLEIHSGLKEAEVLGRTISEIFPQLETERLDAQYKLALSGQVALLSTSLHGHLLPLPSTVPEAPYTWMQQTARIGPLLAGKEICGTITTIEDVTSREWQTLKLKQQHERTSLLSWALANLLRTPSPHESLKELLPKVGAALKADFYASYLFDERSEHLALHTIQGVPPDSIHAIKSITFSPNTSERAKQVAVGNFLQDHFRAGSAWAVQNNLQSFTWQWLMAADRFFGVIVVGTRAPSEFDSEEVDFLSNVAQYVSVAMDRSYASRELFKAQKTLAEHAAHLEKKVDERTATLVDTISDLEGFSYTIAHDLRAPIRHLGAYVEELEAEPLAQNRDVADLLQRMKTATQRMNALIVDLLNYSRVARKELRIQPVNLDTMVNDIVKHHSELAQPGVLVVHHPLENVLAEPTMLQQCMVNLLENARKFVRPGTQPKIEIWKEKARVQSALDAAASGLIFNSPQHLPPSGQNDLPTDQLTVTVPAARRSGPSRNYVRICVADNGIGIQPEFQQKIFGVFERACDPREFEGTGIGLAIVAKAVQRMGGKCGVESAPDRGSRFWLELPAAEH